MRTKRWLLVGTVLPALVLSQAGQAFAPLGVQLAQVPGGDDGRGPRERPGGPAGGPPGQHAPQRPAAPAAPQAPRPPQMQPAPAAPRPPMPAAPAERIAPPQMQPRPAPPAMQPRPERAPMPGAVPGQPAGPRPAPPAAAPVPTERPTPSAPRPGPGVPPAAAPAPSRPAPVPPPAQPGTPPALRPGTPGAAPQPGAQPQRPLPPPGAPARPDGVAPGAPQPGARPGQRPDLRPDQRPDQRPLPPAAPTAPMQPSAPAQPGAVPPAAAPVPGQPNRPVPPGAPPATPGTAVPGRPGFVPPAPGAMPGQPPAGVPGQPPQREGRRGVSPGVAGAIGLGAGVIGGIMASQGAQRFEDIRERRQEQREGDLTVIREPGRTIIRDDDGRAIIRRDEDQRFRDLGWQGRSERRGDENRTVFERPDGTRVVTYTDAEGRLLRRSRIGRDDREIVIIDNTLRDRPGRFADDVVELPPPPLPIPRERYIVDAERADENLIYETIMAPPIAAIPRRYTLDEVRYSPDLRARMRSVDIDTINFATGSWQVTADQAPRLAVIAESVRRVLQGSPNEVFLVEGHTDAVGSDIDNLSLSDRRAQSVAEILTRDFQIPPENLTTQGYGEQYLKVQTQDASRENRRVTLRRITPLLNGENR